jgi:hypothetical protein
MMRQRVARANTQSYLGFSMFPVLRLCCDLNAV